MDNHLLIPQDSNGYVRPSRGTAKPAQEIGYAAKRFPFSVVVHSRRSLKLPRLRRMNTSIQVLVRRELGISQKAAWFMLHRLRLAFDAETGPFAGPVEVDETYIGGKLGNMTAKGRREARQKPDLGKSIVVGAKDRASRAVSARTIEYADKPTLQSFVAEHAAPGAEVYTDEARAYQGMAFDHEAVRHSVGEYVREMSPTNGIESFWAMLKRGHQGIYHKFSPKHLNRYVTDFAGRHNDREADTVDQMTGIVSGMVGKRLTYADLIADNGLDSGART